MPKAAQQWSLRGMETTVTRMGTLRSREVTGILTSVDRSQSWRSIYLVKCHSRGHNMMVKDITDCHDLGQERLMAQGFPVQRSPTPEYTLGGGEPQDTAPSSTGEKGQD